MVRSSHSRACGLLVFGFALAAVGWVGDASAGEPPAVIEHGIVYREDGRFAGSPANHGIWSWGDELLVGGRDDCFLFLTASKANGREGRPFCARTRDGGLTWQFVSFIGPEPSGYAIMPSTVRVSATDLVTTIRRKDPPRSWIDAYGSP